MKLSEKLKKAREHIGKSQREMADLVGSGYRSWQGYEQDTSVPGGKVFQSLAELGFNTQFFFSDDVPMLLSDVQKSQQPQASASARITNEPQAITIDANGCPQIPRWDNPDPEIFDYIPMAKATLSAGGGAFVLSEEIEGYYAFRNSWLNHVGTSKRNLILMRVTGDSMAPTLMSGDTVMLDVGRRTIKEGEIYALRVDNTIIIKRLSCRIGGTVMIISDNREAFEPYEANPADVHVIGQVIFFSRVLITD